ncbi:MAG: hypothetical protein QXS81_01320 [Candidatus Micrarchaeaceae archaeon]
MHDETNDIKKQAQWLNELIEETKKDPELSESDEAMLTAAGRIIKPIFYQGTNFVKELHIPFTDISLSELHYFSEIAVDGDARVVIVKPR